MPLSPVLAMEEERELDVFGKELRRLFDPNKLLHMTRKMKGCHFVECHFMELWALITFKLQDERLNIIVLW